MTGDERSFIGGGYMAALGYNLRDRPQIGDSRLSFGQPIAPFDINNLPDYALLWAGQDPNTMGYFEQDRVWANEFVALYKRGPGTAAAGEHGS